jgi:hypothetical protein
MVRLALLLASLLALAGCTTHCQELGNRLCQCLGTGQTTDSCENAVKNDVQRANPGKSAEAECAKALDTCHAPIGADGKAENFCDFLDGRCGKSLCRISAESYCDTDVCDARIYCKPTLCDASTYCDPSRCGAGVVQIAAGDTPAICDLQYCDQSIVCSEACPPANQPATCNP